MRTGAVAASYALTVFILITLNFVLPRAMPGSPVDAQLSLGSPTYVYDDHARAELAEYYGLDRSLPDQYLDYLGGLATGDLGVSIVNRRSVAVLVGEHLPWTLLLMVTSATLATVGGALAGIHSGWRPGRRVDGGLLGTFIVLQNVPVYVLATLVLLTFATGLGWFPMAGARTSFASFGLVDQVSDVVRHLVLPASVLAVSLAAFQYLLTRAGMVSELGADYLLAGRAKGLDDRRLKYAYAARNAMLPLVANTAVTLSAAVTEMVFVERIFAYPGLGSLLVGSIGSRDYPVLQACFLVLALLVVSLNFLADLVTRRLDPRIAA